MKARRLSKETLALLHEMLDLAAANLDNGGDIELQTETTMISRGRGRKRIQGLPVGDMRLVIKVPRFAGRPEKKRRTKKPTKK